MTDVLPQDTSPDAAARHIAVLKKIGPAGRARMAVELSDNLRDIAMSGIRHRHPEYSRQQVQREYFKLVLDKKLFSEAFGE